MNAERAVMLTRAARMRRAPTEAERRLWAHLRASQLGGFKFRRQATIDSRIVDFFCPAKGLIVEIDGETHEASRDFARDVDLKRRHGFETVRFTNREILENPEGVLNRLLAELTSLPNRWRRDTTPDPSSKEEGSRVAP
jgi:very-short-patch-repair endonuclease